MLVSGVQHSDLIFITYTHTHIYILFQILFLYRLLQNIEYSSLCYRGGSCWLFYYIQQCAHVNVVIFTAVLTFDCVCFGILQVDFQFIHGSCSVEKQNPSHLLFPLLHPLRFRVTKVEPKSNQKERRSLMSVSGTDGVNGEVPVTPVKRQQSDSEQQVSWRCGGMGVGQYMAGRRCIPGVYGDMRVTQEGHRSGAGRALGDRTPSLVCPQLGVKSPSTQVPLEAWPTW